MGGKQGESANGSLALGLSSLVHGQGVWDSEVTEAATGLDSDADVRLFGQCSIPNVFLISRIQFHRQVPFHIPWDILKICHAWF